WARDLDQAPSRQRSVRGRGVEVEDLSAEPTPILGADQRPLAADFELLHGPGIAVGITEPEERPAVVGREDHDLAGLDAPMEQPLPASFAFGAARLPP